MEMVKMSSDGSLVAADQLLHEGDQIVAFFFQNSSCLSALRIKPSERLIFHLPSQSSSARQPEGAKQ